MELDAVPVETGSKRRIPHEAKLLATLVFALMRFDHRLVLEKAGLDVSECIVNLRFGFG